MKKFIKQNKKDMLILLVFVALVVLTRTLFHIAASVEFVTGASITSAFLMKNRKLAFFVPFFGLLFSDLILGNTLIFLFTWSAFLTAPVFGFAARKIAKSYDSRKQNSLLLNTLAAQTSGLIFNVFFFLWTNFGVVVTTSMYPKTPAGLIDSYVKGLPFFKTQAGANLLIVPAVFLISVILLNYSIKFNLSKSLEKLNLS